MTKDLRAELKETLDLFEQSCKEIAFAGSMRLSDAHIAKARHDALRQTLIDLIDEIP